MNQVHDNKHASHVFRYRQACACCSQWRSCLQDTFRLKSPAPNPRLCCEGQPWTRKKGISPRKKGGSNGEAKRTYAETARLSLPPFSSPLP